VDHLRADVGRLSESDGTYEALDASSLWMQSEAVRDRSVPIPRVVPRHEDVVFTEESESQPTSEEDAATFQPPPTQIWVGTLG
jgi:hypothetical protein